MTRYFPRFSAWCALWPGSPLRGRGVGGEVFLLLLGCLGCSPVLYQDLTPTTADASALRALQPEFSTVLYRTQIDVVGKHLSGLLFFKKLDDKSYRVVFTNEMGLNFFDFHFAGPQFEVIHCIDQLNKKAVINQLRKDLGLLLMANLDYPQGRLYRRGEQNYYAFAQGREKTVYVTDAATQSISRIENAAARKLKVVVTLTRPRAGLPDSAFIAHQLFPFTISLKQIPR
jgi:hypothetical protein